MNLARFQERKGRRGMVLIEVIIALTIFAMVSLGLIVALDQSFGAAQDRNQADKAAQGLRNQLTLLHAGRLLPGTHDLPDDGSGTTYQLVVDPVVMTDQHKQPLPSLFRATIQATWKEGTRTETQSVSQLVYQP